MQGLGVPPSGILSTRPLNGYFTMFQQHYELWQLRHGWFYPDIREGI